MSSKTNTWDAAADRELLLAVIDMQKVAVDCERVAKLLSKDGKVYTASAISNRMSKLKKMVKDGGAAAEDGEGTPKSGRKRGAGADGGSATKKRKTPKKDAKSTASDGDDEEIGKTAVKEENGSGDELA